MVLFVCPFFRLISGEAGFNSHLVYGQFVQDNLALSTVGFIGRVWHARRRLFTTSQPFYHPCAYKLTMWSGWINSYHCCTNFSANHPRLYFHLHTFTLCPYHLPPTNQQYLPDDPTGHIPQFRAYLILVIVNVSRLLASICPSLLPFIIIKHDLARRLGPPSSSAPFLFSLL